MAEPQRQDTIGSSIAGPSRASTEPIPGGEKVELAEVFEERLRAWKHVVGYLETYVDATVSIHKTLGKEYEKLAKHVGEPLKEGHMFDTSAGTGIVDLFDQLRTKTNIASQAAHECEKDIKHTVLAQLEKLHADIKAKNKELLSGIVKTAKKVEEQRSKTQKALEGLGSHTATYDSSTGARIEPMADPYIMKKYVLTRLHKQVAEENVLKSESIAVTENFKLYEQSIVTQLHQIVNTLYQHIGAESDKIKASFGEVVGIAQAVTPDFEWNVFTQKYGHIIPKADEPDRAVDAIVFPNSDHAATKAVYEGTLQRKGKMFKSYSPYYYVVTPAKYLHEYKDNKDFINEYEPELSLYLPDCQVGGLTPSPGAKFTITGKDALKNAHITGKHEFTFKASSHEEAERFYNAIQGVTTRVAGMTPPIASPTEELAQPPAYDPGQQTVGVVVPPEKAPLEEKPAAEPAAAAAPAELAGEAGPSNAPADKAAPAAAQEPAPSSAAATITPETNPAAPAADTKVDSKTEPAAAPAAPAASAAPAAPPAPEADEPPAELPQPGGAASPKKEHKFGSSVKRMFSKRKH